MEEVQPEVHERTGCRHPAAGAVGVLHVGLAQVPPAGAHHDGRGALGRDLVALALGAREGELPADRVAQGELSPDDVPPGGARGILLIGQPHLRTRVQGIDRHLRVRRPGDLDPAVLEPGAGAGDPPLRVLADVGGVVAEARVAAVADLEPAPHAGREPVVAPTAEAGVQRRDEGDGIRGEDLVEALVHGAEDLEPGGCPRCRGRRCGRGRGDEGHGRFLSSGRTSARAVVRMATRGSGEAPCGRRADVLDGSDQWNCWASVDPTRARVALSGLSAVETTSK